MDTNSENEDPQSFAVIGAAMEVHRELRNGFLEGVYQDALAVELNVRRIPFKREALIQVRYKGGVLPSHYKADFICFENLLVECKAIQCVGGNEKAQVLNYLRATGFSRGLLLNFGARSLDFHRLIFTPDQTWRKTPPSADRLAP